MIKKLLLTIFISLIIISGCTTDNYKENEKNEKGSIIGAWYNNEKVYVFTENELTIMTVTYNSTKKYKYRIDDDRIIINNTNATEFEIKDNTLYLGNVYLKKSNNKEDYPNIYHYHDAFNGNWKLETAKNEITLSNNQKITLDDEINITEENSAGFESCGGSGCPRYVINFKNEKPELYMNNLCFELSNENTLTQIKCQNNNLNGYSEWEDKQIHSIIYTKVK